MKVISQQVERKSDADGVIINIRSSVETTAAFEKISRDVKTPIPGSVIDSIIVEQLLPVT